MTAREVALLNLAGMVANFGGVGVDRLLVAHTLTSRSEVDRLEKAIGVRPRGVRLLVSYPEIAARLSTAATTGRQDDLRRAKEQLRDGVGAFGDLAVENDGSVPDLAHRILEWLGWVHG